MRPLSCEEVDDLLPWYAAGECDPEPRGLVEQHLAHCPRCRQGYAEAERLAALLDWHHRAGERLQRLQGRLREEWCRGAPRRAVLPFVRRFSAVAALLLVAVGLTGWVSPPREESSEVVVALVAGGEDVFHEHGVVRAFGPNLSKAEALRARDRGTKTMSLDLGGRSPEVYRQRLLKATEAGRFPEAPRVDLTLEVRNRGGRVLYLDAGSEGTELRLDLSGPGMLTLSGAARSDPPFLSRRLVQLAPGESYFLPVRQLIDGTRGQLRSLYWTEPGRYTLRAHYRVRVSDSPPAIHRGRDVWSIRTFVSSPLTIQVLRR